MYHIIHKKYVYIYNYKKYVYIYIIIRNMYIYNYIGTVYIPWKEGEESECQLGGDLDPPAINRRPACVIPCAKS